MHPLIFVLCYPLGRVGAEGQYFKKLLIKQEYFTQLIEARVQKHFVSICNQRPGKKLALEIEAGRK